jgi:FtsZ-interacting cell division protein YlmF
MADPKEPDKPEEPKYVTVDELAALLKAREDKFFSRVTAETGKLAAKLDAFGKAREEEKKEPAPAAEPGTTKVKIEESPEYKGLLRRLAENEERTKAAEERATAEAARARDSKMRQVLNEELVAAGVDSKMVKHAIGYLVDAEKRVKTLENGSIVFVDGPDEVEFKQGFRGWLKTDDAKVYLSPRGVQGSGDAPAAKTQQRQNQEMPKTREELALALQSALAAGGGINVG